MRRPRPRTRTHAATWLALAILSVQAGDIAGGTGPDCNQNGVPDEQDLRAGDLILQGARSFAAGERPVAIAAGDLDGDQDSDLVTANRDSNDVAVLLNRGDGSFAAPLRFHAGDKPISVALADLDGDGDLDIAAASIGSEGGGVSALFNLGAGTYAPRVPLTGVPTPNSIAAGDIDGDGDVDLVAADAASGVVSIFENDGDGGFGEGEGHDVGEEPSSVVLADLDRDDHLDIAVLTLHGSPAELEYDASILFNEGEGTFAEPARYPAAEWPMSMIAADLDGDSYLDLAITESPNDRVSILQNLGNRTFASGRLLFFERGSDPAGLAAGDLDGDGDVDIAVANSVSEDIAVLLNPFFDSFLVTAPRLLAGKRPFAVATADLDGDADLDIASANSGIEALQASAADPGDVSILLNGGSASFPTPDLFPANVVEGPDSGGAAFVLAGDFDGDADLDIITASERTEAAFIRNEGDRMLARPERLNGSGPSAAAADLDRDGDLDLVLVSTDRKALLVLLNSGNGAFAEPMSFAAGESPVAAAAADLDGDEDIDLAAADAASSQLAVLLNSGTRAFGPASLLDVGSSPASVTAADLDGDGDADLASADSGSDGVSVLENEGGGAFAPARSYPAGQKPVSLAAGDLDGDGDVDLVTADEESDTVSVLLNDGDGTFAPRVALMAGRSPVSAALGDIDGDADLDIVSGDTGSNGVSIFRNDGSGTFEKASRFSSGGDVVSVADLDRNGVPDIVAVNTPIRTRSDEVEDHLSVLWNATVPPSSSDIDRDGVPDECESRAVSRLGTAPDPIIVEGGTKAVAFAGTIAAESLGEDLVWEGAVFENVGRGDASTLVTTARLYADTNGDGALDGGDRPIGSPAAFDPTTQQVAFANLAEPLVPVEPEAMLLVLDLAEKTEGTMGLSPSPEDAGSVLALLVTGVLAALCLRRGWLRRISWAPALLLLTLLVVPPGCGGDGDGGQQASSSQLEIRLTALEVSGAESGLPAAIDGLPLIAWPIDP